MGARHSAFAGFCTPRRPAVHCSMTSAEGSLVDAVPQSTITNDVLSSDDVPANVAGIFLLPALSPYLSPAAIMSPQAQSILSSVPPCLVRRVDQAEGGYH